MMNFKDLEAFVAVAETGSVGRAAIRLNLTQSAVTRRIQNFENTMGGSPLLDRTAKPPRLTPHGRQLLDQCRQALILIRNLSTNREGPPSGKLRVGIAHGLADKILAGPLNDLRQRFPLLSFEVTSDWSRELTRKVEGAELDCAIVAQLHDEPTSSRLVKTALAMDRVAIVAATNGRYGKTKLRLTDLEGDTWVLHPEGCGFRGALRRALDRAGLPLNIAAEVFDRDLRYSLIKNGVGLGVVASRSAKAARGLKMLRVVDFDLEVVFAVVHHPTLGNLAAPTSYLMASAKRALA